jgi:PAS domain S-box-containing protein
MADEPSDAVKQVPISKTKDGLVDTAGKRTMLMDVAGGLYGLKKTLMADIGFFEKDFMYRAGREGSKDFLMSRSSHEIPSFPRGAIEQLLREYSDRGYGDFKVTNVDPERHVVQLSCSNTMEAWAFEANNDLQRQPVCSYTAGMLTCVCQMAFFGECIDELDLKAVEVECVAEGRKECKFIIAPISELRNLVSSCDLPRDLALERDLRLNEEILMKNLELQNFNLSLERQIRKKTEELRKSEENHRSLADLSVDPVIVTEIDSKVVYINRAGLKMLGYDDLDDLKGKNLTSVLAKKKEDWERFRWALDKEGSVSGQEMELVRKDGTRAFGEISARFVDMMPGRCIEAVISDVTGRRTMEGEIQKAKSEADFLNSLLSHDVINYTFSATHFLENLEKSSYLTDDDRKSLSVAMRDVRGAFELASSVRDLSRVKDLDGSECKAEQLHPLIEEAITEARRMHPEKNAQITFSKASGAMTVKGHPMISRVFACVITNAIKFDPSPEPLIDIVSERVIENGRACWKTTVSDRGHGIPDEEKERVFEKFHRLDTSVPGNGLGLYVSRFITDACGGRIWVEDRVPKDHTKGTSVVVLLESLGPDSPSRNPPPR